MPLPAALLLAALALDGADAQARAFLEAHCLACHAGDAPEGDLDLAPLADGARGALDLELVHERVDLGEMPPRSRPAPRAQDAARFLAWLEQRWDVPPPAARPLDPGRPVLRRLAHREYANTVRDLLGVELGELYERFPAETAGGGFDHLGETQSLSEELFVLYVDLAEQVAARAWTSVHVEDLAPRRADATQLEGSARSGRIVLTTNGTTDAPFELAYAGTYTLRVRAAGDQAGPEPARMAAVVDGRAVARFDVPQTRDAPALFECEVELAGGAHRIGAAFLNDYYRPEAEDPAQRDRNLHVWSVEVEGPHEPPAVTALQRELAGARRPALLAHLAGRLWRRPATPAELARLAAALPDPDAVGDDDWAQAALALLLASPDFLYRFEGRRPDPERGARAAALAGARPLRAGVVALDGYELATRLAYFLWSSAPDTELLRAAHDGTLVTDAGLRAQAERLLADPRASALVEDFAAQWLHLGLLERLVVDTERFPEFDPRLRASMRAETLRFVSANLFERRDVRELLTSSTSEVDRALARLYGLDERPAQGAWVTVELPPERRGLLGQASVLALTSEPTRTSPVRRGKWLLEVLLDAPVPPPPPDAGPLPGGGSGASAATVREELAQHRARPDCAVCHDALDPLGLVLEGFGPTGRLRREDAGEPVDTRGRLPDGRELAGPDDLRALLVADPAFVRAVVTRLYVYALGRGLERGDRPLLDEVLARLDPERPTLYDAIHAIVQSPAFRLLREDPR
ncbi:MAG: DUF1592 domain-containing protein [Planctomycetes bacterium]|nr:DUF1592 domain-containing protein [Planctomycetota bacterium]